jgi:uncharacterized protein
MIVDCNCMLGPWPFRKVPHSEADGFVGLMDGYGITQAWVGAVEGIFYRDLAAANEGLIERIAGHEDRLVPWAVINPAFPGWEEDLQAAEAGGFVGLRLYPNYHDYELTDPCVLDLLGAAQALRWPVAIYHKVQDERLHHWRMPVPPTDFTGLKGLVERFPGLPLLIMGQTAQFAAQHAAVFAVANVYLDISRCEGLAGVADMARAVGANRVLFGSHAPFFYLEAAVLKIQEAGLTEADRELILHGNAGRVLG